MSEDAGKGDTYRDVNREKWDESYERIFGKKDIMEFHKDGPHREKKQQFGWEIHEEYLLGGVALNSLRSVNIELKKRSKDNAVF